jgi:hypothetical protein
MLGMAAFFIFYKYPGAEKNMKTEVTTNITTVKDSDGDKKVIQTKEVEEFKFN